MCIMVLIFVLFQIWAATDSGNLEVTYTHTEELVGAPKLLVLQRYISNLHPEGLPAFPINIQSAPAGNEITVLVFLLGW
jgi:hypothetical protein